ncbi:MAG TPA: hypothetical protein VFA27_09535 [Vicinamibacterales bacterium]|nr:hypothetical protein [Vicinamibacterales bacterium]
MVTTFAIWTLAIATAAGPGPIAASLARHAADSLVVETLPPADDGWWRLERIRPGAEVVMSTTRDTLVPRVFVSFDAASMTVLNLRDPVLPRVAVQRLRDVAEIRSRAFDADRITVGFETDDRVRVSAAGVFVDGSRICDTDRIVERIPRASVRLVKGTGDVHASKAAVVTGVVLGELVGLGLLGSAIDCRIDESITGCRLQVFGPLWAPIAGGTLGYFVTRRVDETVFYRHD